MTREEKLLKAVHDFSLLPREKQDNILSVLQALTFAHDTTNEQNDVDPSGSEQKAESV